MIQKHKSVHIFQKSINVFDVHFPTCPPYLYNSNSESCHNFLCNFIPILFWRYNSISPPKNLISSPSFRFPKFLLHDLFNFYHALNLDFIIHNYNHFKKIIIITSLSLHSTVLTFSSLHILVWQKSHPIYSVHNSI